MASCWQFRPAPLEKINAYYSESGQELIFKELKCPRAEPTMIILLNGHSIKISSQGTSSYANEVLIPHQTGFFALRKAVNSETDNRSKCREKVSGDSSVTNHTEDLYIILRLGDYNGREGGQIVGGRSWRGPEQNSKTVFWKLQAAVLKNTQRVWLSAQNVYKVKPVNIPAQRGGGSLTSTPN